MAFTTVSGSNGVTSLVGTTGTDIATIATLQENVFVGGNTGNDTLTVGPLALTTGNNVASKYDVRMGGGDDTFTLSSDLVNSFISLDGEVLANDGDDTFNTVGDISIINSEIVGRGGNDEFSGFILLGSTVNGNTGNDTIYLGTSTSSFVYGGADTDTIYTSFNSAGVLINGNKGSDTILLSRSQGETLDPEAENLDPTTGAFESGSVYGGNGNDVINALFVTNTAGNPLAVTNAGVLLSGDLGDDTVTGSNGIDTINGGDGNDVINGASGADKIDGGAGNDTITGGAGADTIAGGSGNNVFVYTTLTDATVSGSSGFDTITGFSANTNAATINGDRFDVTAAPVAAAAIKSVTLTAAATLQATLETLTNADLGVNGVALVNIGGANAFAGNYVVIGDGTAGYNNAADAVIKVNTLANIGAATFI